MFMVLIGLCPFAGYFSEQFTVDASADTLVAESDPDLLYYRKIVNYFGEEDFLFLTYKPIYDDLLSKEAIEKIDLLSRQLRERLVSNNQLFKLFNQCLIS